jgi:hypothetical protein
MPCRCRLSGRAKGLQRCIEEFHRLNDEVELGPILDQLAARPPLELTCSDELESLLPAIIGGLSVALAHSFKIIDPELKNPATEDWQRSLQIFELLL